MDLPMANILLLTLFHFTSVYAVARFAFHQCEAVFGDPDSVRIVFHITQNDDPTYKVYAFDPTKLDTTTDTNRVVTAECIKDGSTEPIVYDTTVTITDTVHACGALVVDDGGVTVVQMLFRLYSESDQRLETTDANWLLQCSMDDLNGLWTSTSEVEFSTDHVLRLAPPQIGVHLRILNSEGKAPLHITKLGQQAIISVETLSEQSLGPDNWGTHYIVGFLGNDNGDTAAKLAVVIQPRYTLRTDIAITTLLDGERVLQEYKIEDGSAFTVSFAEDYMGCAEDGSSDQAFIGIEINSDHMEIGVLVCNLKADSSDCYTALPSDVIGTEYWGTSMMVENEASEFMIISHEDGTVVTIDVPTGSGHTNDGTTETVTLNKLEAYHYSVMTADPDTSHVNGYHVQSDLSFTFLAGNNGYQNQHLSVQLPPQEKYGRHYVLVSVDFLNDGRSTLYILQAITDLSTTVTQYLPDSASTEYVITSATYPPQTISVASGTVCELIGDNPFMVTQVVQPLVDAGIGPSIRIMPSVEQWAPSYRFNFDSTDHSVTSLVVFKSEEDISQYKVNGATLTLGDPVTVNGPNGYVYTQGTTLPGHLDYTVYLEDGVTTMMVLLYASDSGVLADSVNGISLDGFGMRYAGYMVCIPVGRKGDGVDNDCDGLIDEDGWMDKIDNDLDGSTGEDQPATPSDVAGAVAVRPINCKASGDPTFPTERTVQLTGADGCAITGDGSFKPVSELVSVAAVEGFENHKILQSGAFRLGMFIGPDPRVYFMCEIEKYCTDSTDEACTVICNPSITRRRKRALDDGYPKNVTSDIWVFPFIDGKNDASTTNETYIEASLGSCLDNTYIQVLFSSLAAVAITSLFTTFCFCYLIRRKNNRDKHGERRRHYLDMFRKKSF